MSTAGHGTRGSRGSQGLQSTQVGRGRRGRAAIGQAAAAVAAAVASALVLTACSFGSAPSSSASPAAQSPGTIGVFPTHGAATGSMPPLPPGAGTDGMGATATASPPGRPAVSAPPAVALPELSASAQPLPVHTDAPAPPGVPAVGDVDRTDAVATARAAVATMWASDTATDASEREASLRAAPYLVPELAAQMRRDAPVAGPGTEWQEWARHRAYLAVTAELADEMGKPPDTTATSVHTLQVTVTPIGRDGWRGAPRTHTVMISLVRADAGPWQVDFLQVRM
ncbi:hypothetical protein OG216_31910 [Streptomycetaceae bacterium NBC_01309]